MNTSISDLRATIVPRSDQMNSEQLISGPVTITVTDVRIGNTEEQPLAIHYPDDDGRPYKPAKTMRKVLIFAWGADGHEWIGKSMTLYCDPHVKFGGTEVGGIRISHLSHIDKPLQLSLTATKGKKATHVIHPLVAKDYAAIVRSLEVTARAKGFDALREAWELLSEEDAAAIGKAELKRLKAIAQQPKTEEA